MATANPETIDVAGIIARLPLFAEITPAQLEQVVAEARIRQLAKGEMLFNKGDPARGFFVVARGQVKLGFPSAQGNEKVVHIVGPRQSFGEAVMFMDRPFPVFAEAVADTAVIHIPRKPVIDLIQRDATFALAMLAGLSVRLHMLIDDVERHSLRSSAQRVIGYLLQQCPPQGSGPVEIALPTSKHLIASLLNLTPETLSRIFRDLGDAGLIEVRGRTIGIPDLAKLREADF